MRSTHLHELADEELIVGEQQLHPISSEMCTGQCINGVIKANLWRVEVIFAFNNGLGISLASRASGPCSVKNLSTRKELIGICY